MKFSDKLYNFLKYFICICMPAILGLWKIVSAECDLNLIAIYSTNIADFVTNIWVGIEVALGAIFCIENGMYSANKEG